MSVQVTKRVHQVMNKIKSNVGSGRQAEQLRHGALHADLRGAPPHHARAQTLLRQGRPTRKPAGNERCWADFGNIFGKSILRFELI